MGVPTRIVIYARNESEARDAAAGAFARIAELEQVMSDYRPDSELMRLCAADSGLPHRVSPDLFCVLRTAQHVSAATDGAFDATIGPCVDLWRRSARSGHLPSTPELADARARCGHALLGLDPATRSITLHRPGMRLDLGGIGKGFAAQQAVEHLGARGHPRCLVALAGDIVVGSPPPGAPGWMIELPPSAAGPKSLILRDSAVSTSGATEQFVSIEGVRYAHIVDPRTGLGATTCATVTIIAPRGELSDALATAASLIGPADFAPILRRFPGCAMPAVVPGGPSSSVEPTSPASLAAPGVLR